MQKNTFVNLWQKNYFFEWKILFFIIKFLIGILFLKLNLNDSIHDKIKNHNLLVHGWYSPKGLRDMSSSSHNFILEQKSIFSFYFIYSMIGARKYTLHHDFKSEGRFQEMALGVGVVKASNLGQGVQPMPFPQLGLWKILVGYIMWGVPIIFMCKPLFILILCIPF